LRNQINIEQTPFSDRGSRLLLYKEKGASRFYIKLAERLISLDENIEAYLERPAFIREMTLLDEDGQPMPFEVVSYPHILHLQTKVGDFAIAFQDIHTLALGFPAQVNAGVRFEVSPQLWKETPMGGEFRAVRDLGYATNGELLQSQVTPCAGGYQIETMVKTGDDTSMVFSIGNGLPSLREVEPFSTVSDQAEKRWQDWFKGVPPVIDKYRRTYAYAWWVMANNLIKPRGKIAYEAMVPSKGSYVGLWLWDSAMHALAYRHADAELARNQIRAMLACQLPDGMLPDAVYDDGVIAEIEHPIKAKVTKPPILAWAALKLHDVAPDLAFLEEIYVPLVRWNAWWFSMNDDDADGLAQYNHPYSSGLDDNPLWDYGMPVESPDLNTYLCVQMGSLAMIAELLGMDAEAGMWRRRSTAIVNRMVQDFWDEEAGIFRALHDNQPIPVITPFNLYPLWTGQLPGGINERILAHLINPDMFWGDYAIPSVARNDPTYDPDRMWRGPVWANVNYFFIEALHQLGEHELANCLTEKTLDLIVSHPGLYEYYNAESGDPPLKAAEAFGWTAAVFIDLAISASRQVESMQGSCGEEREMDPDPGEAK
jgi:putative isomerase